MLLLLDFKALSIPAVFSFPELSELPPNPFGGLEEPLEEVASGEQKEKGVPIFNAPCEADLDLAANPAEALAVKLPLLARLLQTIPNPVMLLQEGGELSEESRACHPKLPDAAGYTD